MATVQIPILFDVDNGSTTALHYLENQPVLISLSSS